MATGYTERDRDSREGARAGRSDSGVDGMARGLGWFSLALGAAELVAPGRMAELIGLENHDRNRKLLRGYGAREIAAGVGILAQPSNPAWVWSRVAGDVLDLASLVPPMRAHDDERRRRAGMAMAAVAGVTLLDFYTARRLGADRGRARRPGAARPALRRRTSLHATKVVTINRPASELYRFWRDFRNLPRFMEHLEAVQVIDDTRSHWVVRAPAGTQVEWLAEIVDDQPDRLIAWRSLEGADVPNSGSVEFRPAPGGRGTEVRVELAYAPPGGRIGAAFARLFGEEPNQQVADDLRHFKQLMETGEVVLSEGTLPGNRAAQPPARAVVPPGRDVDTGVGAAAGEPSVAGVRGGTG